MTTKLLIAGVLALDDLKTPNKTQKGIIGGAGIYSSISASLFTDTTLVAAIGNDFPKGILEKIKKRGINTQSIKKLDYPTFHWSGEYKGDMSQAITHETDFRINDYYDWEVNSEQKKTNFLLLCNNDPTIQLRILEQVEAKLIAMDTMNLWIDIAKEKLETVVSQVDILFINDAEAQQYSETQDLEKAARILLNKGPKYVVIKKGKKGASLHSKEFTKKILAFQVDNFVDPTGAGDSFAGAVIGYLANLDKINKAPVFPADNVICALPFFCDSIACHMLLLLLFLAADKGLSSSLI